MMQPPSRGVGSGPNVVALGPGGQMASAMALQEMLSEIHFNVDRFQRKRNEFRVAGAGMVFSAFVRSKQCSH